MKFRWLLGVFILVALGLLIACSSSNISNSTTVASMLFTSLGDQSIESWQVNLTNGLITQVGSEVSVGANAVPVAVKFTPDGKAAFVVNRGVPPSGTDNIATFTVNDDGSVSFGANVPSGGVNPTAEAIDPTGKFLFVANQGLGGISGTSTISVYTISGSNVTFSANFPADDFASGIAVSPIANFVYVTNTIGSQPLLQGEVTQYSYDPMTGALNKVNTYLAGTTPSGIAIAPKGQYLYVSNFGSNNVSGFTIASDGTLSPTNQSPYPAGIGPQAMVADPVENFLFVADFTSNQISAYKISAASGQLSPLAPAAVSTGMTPVDIAIDPTGVYLYTANLAAASLSGFHVNPTTGALGPIQNPFTTPGQPSAIALH